MSDLDNRNPGWTGGDLAWRFCRFDDLTLRELQFIYMARQEVFAIEQQCVYLDVDGLDERSFHVVAWSAGQLQPMAYARLIDPGLKYEEASMGRVITTSAARGRGLGRELVARAIAHAEHAWPGGGLRISAQTHLVPFYESFGFVAMGLPYLEDGIDHTEMLRTSSAR